ncbi:MAG: alpha/beta fold hydrolase [Anaerolineae bacterium]|nr:alpha/beta fold hydrolase [Anaerolineae bacterium]
MKTHFCAAPDGARLAYDMQGNGPALLLLHGGGGLYDRRTWHKAGYVARLQEDFTVVTLDLRGNGESDKPTSADAYHVDRFYDDVFAVADACGWERFAVWGYSFGANVARYLAARSDRISRAVLVGAGFGPTMTPGFTRWLDDYLTTWQPFIAAQERGELDLSSLPNKDRKVWTNAHVEYWYHCFQAMRDWEAVQPAAMRCPFLALVGTKNRETHASLTADHAAIQAAGGELVVLEGLGHPQEFNQIDSVLPLVLPFLK